MVLLSINKQDIEVDVSLDTPLLWVLRDNLNLTGTKFACGIGQCGACTVLINGRPVRSCITTTAEAQGYDIITIEGLSSDASHPVQLAFITEDVPQCGYCQSGQIMKAAELLSTNKQPSRDEIVKHMNSNICRCGTYPRIVRAVQRAAKEG